MDSLPNAHSLRLENKGQPFPIANGSDRGTCRALPLLDAAVAAIASASSAPAIANDGDGCKVMLCLAAPNWRNVPECVPPVQRVMNDLRRGRPFPRCETAGVGNSTTHVPAHAPDFCPPQYTRFQDRRGTRVYTCDYAGAITASVNGQLFTRTWWSLSGDAVTEFSPAAKAQLGSWDDRFEREYAAWLTTAPASPVVAGQ